jgi:hypothetical protein
MNDWIFQCNPKRYGLKGAMARSLDRRWNAPQHWSHIALGDRVWLAIVGSRDAGIHFLARETSLPYEISKDEFGFSPWRTDIQFEARIGPCLARVELLDDPVLAKVSAPGASKDRIACSHKKLANGCWNLRVIVFSDQE